MSSSEQSVLNALSVDVEDYFQVGLFEHVISRSDWAKYPLRVEANTRQLLEVMNRTDAKATFFVLGWIAERLPQLVREISTAGHELAIHGYDHRSVTSMTPEEFRKDVRKAKGILEATAGVEVIGYRAPNYSIVKETLWAADVLLEEGFRYDSSIFPIFHDRYGIPDAPRFPWLLRAVNGNSLIEFPISTIRLLGFNLPFVGGGYLRQLPWRYIQWGMRRVVLGEHQPAVVYVHPWELDPGQPRILDHGSKSVRHYRNLDKTKERLEALCREYRFGTMGQVLGSAFPDEMGKQPYAPVKHRKEGAACH